MLATDETKRQSTDITAHPDFGVWSMQTIGITSPSLIAPQCPFQDFTAKIIITAELAVLGEGEEAYSW